MRRAELLRELHEPERLPVPLGVRHAEVARDVLAGIPPLLVADDDHGRAVEAREAADDGLVVAVDPIAVQLHPVLEEQSHEIERVRALRVPRDLGALPGRQAPVDLLLEPSEAVLEARDLVAGAPRILGRPELDEAGSRSRSAASRNQARPAYSTSILPGPRSDSTFATMAAPGSTSSSFTRTTTSWSGRSTCTKSGVRPRWS